MSSRNTLFCPALLSEVGMPGNHCCHLSSHLLNVNYFEVRPATLWTEKMEEKERIPGGPVSPFWESRSWVNTGYK